MILKTFVVGMIENNNYLLIDENSKEAVLIDCSEYISEIEENLKKYDAKLKYVLITHGHFDHILGLEELHKVFPETPILAPINYKELIEDVSSFVDRFVGGLGHVNVPPITKYIDENESLSIGNSKITVINTPGHTSGGVCYLVDDKLFSGDTIFLGSVGRTDFGGNYQQLKNSVQYILNSLDEDIKIYPGHGDLTTIKYEKINNPMK